MTQGVGEQGDAAASQSDDVDDEHDPCTSGHRNTSFLFTRMTGCRAIDGWFDGLFMEIHKACAGSDNCIIS
ncbi:MAG: hypothetical protein HFF84_09365 [Oscillibacter sp.]|nr:hypothetical protein [Oscillibacter sp.]